VPVTAIRLFGFFLKILNEILASNFLIFFVLINKTPFFHSSKFFSVTIILQPFFITDGMKLLPSKLFPLIAKKI
jgi:hypothetical protein